MSIKFFQRFNNATCITLFRLNFSITFFTNITTIQKIFLIFNKSATTTSFSINFIYIIFIAIFTLVFSKVFMFFPHIKIFNSFIPPTPFTKLIKPITLIKPFIINVYLYNTNFNKGRSPFLTNNSTNYFIMI